MIVRSYEWFEKYLKGRILKVSGIYLRVTGIEKETDSIGRITGICIHWEKVPKWTTINHLILDLQEWNESHLYRDGDRDWLSHTLTECILDEQRNK